MTSRVFPNYSEFQVFLQLDSIQLLAPARISLETKSYCFYRRQHSSCRPCQKIGLNIISDIQPIIKSLDVERSRSRIGIDSLTITPADKNGNTLIIVIVEHFSKFSTLYPASNRSADTLATC